MEYETPALMEEALYSPKVAAVEGYRFSQDYVSSRFTPDQITWYSNEYLPNYKYRGLQSSRISYSHALSVGVEDSQILFTVI